MKLTLLLIIKGYIINYLDYTFAIIVKVRVMYDFGTIIVPNITRWDVNVQSHVCFIIMIFKITC